jgi:Ca2+/Na+ antiporter
LFYCFYCLVIKRPNDNSHVRALTLLGVTLTNLFVLLIIFVFWILSYELNLTTVKTFGILLFCFIFLSNKLENKYYLDNGNYLLAIKKHEENYSKFQKRILGLFSFSLFIGSVTLIIYLGINFSKN